MHNFVHNSIRFLRGTFALGFMVSSSCVALAQQANGSPILKPVPQTSRIAAGADFAPRIQLNGHLPRWAVPSNLDVTPVDLLTTLRLSIVLRRAPQVESALEQLAADQQNPASPLYRQWLTPQQIGALYGPTQADVDAVSAWLTSQGMHIESVSPSRMIVEVTAPAASVANAFRVSFGYYHLGGKARLSATSEPYLPAALSQVVRAIDGLSDVPLDPGAHGRVGKQPSSGSSAPQPGYTTSSGSHYIAPGDFTTIYDIGSVYSSGNTGATIAGKAQHIAVIDRSDVAATDIAEWATNVGITKYTLNTILATGVDPGATANGDQLEATLDVNQTIATANGAITDLVVAPNSTGGIFAAASYNVNTLVDPVMSISFYGCEANAGAVNTAKWDTLFQTAAVEGISTFVCAGDSGAAGCASDFSAPPATTPVRSVNYICSSTYATCVGGTEFNDTANPAAYWASTNAAGKSSALSYIPEGSWNEAQQTANGVTTFDIQSGGGGASIYIAKPSWQVGTGVPADGARDQPDLSFTSAAHDGYYSCLAYSGGNCANGYFEYFAGTSAAAPNMAAITALLNTRAGASQGNLNPLLYRLAATTPAAFHDVTVASSGVTNCSTAVASMCNNSTPSPAALTGGLAGYAVTSGYDQATGLGSLDVTYFLAAASPVPTNLSLAVSGKSLTAPEPVTFTASLTPASTSVAAPTGTVQFYVDGTAFGSPVSVSGNSATVSDTFATAGTHQITATYSGDNYFSTSSSPIVQLVVVGSFTLTASPTALSFNSGATAGNTATVSVASTAGFAGPVGLTCTISASTAAFQPMCAVAPASVTLAAGGTGSATITISSTVAQARLTQPSGFHRRGMISAAGAFSLASLTLLLLPRRRRSWRYLVSAVCTIAAMTCVSGCSSSKGSTSSTTLRSSAGSYTVTINGTGTQAGSPILITAGTTFSLTIQ